MRRLLITATVVLCATTACGSDDGDEPSAAAGGSLQVTNCDRPLQFDGPPERIVSLWPSITEMLIALGAGDRIVGQAFTDQSPPLPEYAEEYDDIEVLSENAVSREPLLAARPDLIVADGEYHFDGTELPTIDDLADLGIQVYIVSSFCHGEVTTGRVADFRTDLRDLGTIVGAPERAAAMQESADSRLAGVAERISGREPIPLVLCQIYDGALYAEAEGIYSDVVNLAGGRNMYDGQLPPDQYYAQVSIEDVAKKNPATIVYLSNDAEDRAQAEDFLRRTFPTVDAVRNNRLIPLPSLNFINLRAVDGVVGLADELHGTP